ncbi:hypothetical protein GCM10017788_65400 [Amycolatopsis acidiphila]|nr:hypothetical protein GCM10017788_65400 [Amycolatopsis acidiphila]
MSGGSRAAWRCSLRHRWSRTGMAAVAQLRAARAPTAILAMDTAVKNRDLADYDQLGGADLGWGS